MSPLPFECFAVSAAQYSHHQLGMAYATAPLMGLVAVAAFTVDSSAISHSACDLAASLAVNDVASNCHHRAASVSCRVLAQESERRDTYSVERFLGSVRLANWRVREEVGVPGLRGSMIALRAWGGAATVARVGSSMSLHIVRQGCITAMLEHEEQDACGWLGAANDVEIRLLDQDLATGDVLVICPIRGLGRKMATVFASEPNDFERALVTCFRGFDPPCFRGLVARWLG